MHDALTELSDLSLQLQKRSITLPDADNSIRRTIKVFESMFSFPGEFSEETTKVAQNMKFKNIDLQCNAKVVAINNDQFFRSLVDNMRNRLVYNINRASNERLTSTCDNKMVNMIEDLKVLDKKNWPSEVNIRYGEKSIFNLCEQFQLHEKRSTH